MVTTQRSYFYATLNLGTPARKFEVIVDTGSTITYVPCADCSKTNCGKHKVGAGEGGGGNWLCSLLMGAPKCCCPPITRLRGGRGFFYEAYHSLGIGARLAGVPCSESSDSESEPPNSWQKRHPPGRHRLSSTSD